jgi:hypothetical protein
MENWLLALLVKPFVAVVAFFLLYCCRRAFARYCPDSRIKRLLLRPLFQRQEPANRQEPLSLKRKL